MATSWSDLPPVDDEPRRRVGYRAAGAVALTAGAGGEVAFHTVGALHDLVRAWQAARWPAVALVMVLLAQVPLDRRRPAERHTRRAARSELRRHLDRARRGE